LLYAKQPVAVIKFLAGIRVSVFTGRNHMPKGYLALLLHAHLPFVRHPEYSNFLEEDWLFEAITETYIPLLLAYNRMRNDGVPFKVTMSLTPPLLCMLGDDILQKRYDRHLNKLVELAEKEVKRTNTNGHLNYLAQYYLDHFNELRGFWNGCNHDLISEFRKFMEIGNLDIITCGATHGYLPLMKRNPKAVNAQIKVAVDTHEQFLGVKPKGIWLPECAFYEGLDKILAKNGLRYFVVDTHGILFAHPRPKYQNYAPLFCNGSGVAAFGRDLETSVQVWSKDSGYPGDPDYREFYRDIGYDLELDYIKPYIQPNGERKNTGIKYHRITGKGGHKELYDPYWAREKAAMHSANFMYNREKQIEFLSHKMDREPFILAPYDAELFGHWWFEGPQWIEFLFRKSVYDQNTYELTHMRDYLSNNPVQQVSSPAESSWGNAGYHEFWLSDSNGWIYRHLHKAADRMTEMANKYPDAYDLYKRVLDQMARELLLAQSSDWAFIIKSDTMVEYARKRTVNHLRRFTRFYNELQSGQIDEDWLNKVEAVDNIFPQIDYKAYL
jgi:1,4-alpha-glucan branching enzyme